MAKTKNIPERPGLLIARFFKNSVLSQSFKTPADWLSDATKLSLKFCKQLITGKAKLTKDNAIKIAAVSGLKLGPSDLLAAEMAWRPYCELKYPKPTETTHQQIVVACRRAIWLNSVERRTALKNADYKCEGCGIRQTAAKGKEVKLDVHHRRGNINWAAIVEVIRKELLQPPEQLKALCKCCHDKEH